MADEITEDELHALIAAAKPGVEASDPGADPFGQCGHIIRIKAVVTILTIEMIAKAILSKETSNSKGGQHERIIAPRA